MKAQPTFSSICCSDDRNVIFEGLAPYSVPLVVELDVAVEINVSIFVSHASNRGFPRFTVQFIHLLRPELDRQQLCPRIRCGRLSPFLPQTDAALTSVPVMMWYFLDVLLTNELAVYRGINRLSSTDVQVSDNLRV